MDHNEQNKNEAEKLKRPARNYISRQGRRADLGNRFFRSKVEANYARFLNYLKEQGLITDWEYEPDEFEFPVKRGTRFYKPDFKVFFADGSFVYHEIKGFMDAKSRVQLKRMAIHHPEVQIIVKDAEWYKQNAPKLKSLIPNWEK